MNNLDMDDDDDIFCETQPNDFVKGEYLMQKIVPDWALNCSIDSGLYSSPEIRHQNGLDSNGKPCIIGKNYDHNGNSSSEQINR